MGLGKKTIKMVTKLLGDDKRRQLYTEEEIKYMQRQVVLLKLQARSINVPCTPIL